MDEGRLPLHEAAYQCLPAMAEIFLQHGADVNARDDYGMTPLHWTAKHDGNQDADYRMARLLLQHGADPQAQDQDGETPLQIATGRNPRMARILLTKSPTVDFLSAVRLSDLERVKHFCQHLREDPATFRKIFFRPPFRHARFSQPNPVYLEIVAELIKAGVSPNEETSSGSALFYACLGLCPTEIIQFLIDSGADVNYRSQWTDFGATPLEVAKRRGDHELVAILQRYSSPIE